MLNAQLSCHDVSLVLSSARQDLEAIERLIASGTAEDLKRACLIARYRHAAIMAAQKLHACNCGGRHG